MHIVEQEHAHQFSGSYHNNNKLNGLLISIIIAKNQK